MTNKEKKTFIARYVQIFAAKMILEVFGGGGAIWGSTAIVKLRDSQTEETWRFWAAIFGAIFFIRFCGQLVGIINKIVGNKRTDDETANTFKFVQIFSAKFVLEVLGGGGALWGSTEALGLRNNETQEFWRFWCIIFLNIFLLRFIIQARDYLKNGEGPNFHPLFCLVQVFSAKFVLEVLGAAGAIWGWSEVVTLRNPETTWLWRPISLTVGAIFFCRWVLQIHDFVAEISHLQLSATHLIRLCEIFSAKLILEVFGDAGAIWGFSEAVNLRNDSNIWFWRPFALTFGAIFFSRWLLQINDFLIEKSKELSDIEERIPKDDDTDQTESSDICEDV